MTLLELCEPLFQCVCRLNRSARKGGNDEYAQVRAEIEAIFKDLRARAATEPAVKDPYARMEPILVYFVDSMIAESPAGYAGQWHRNRLAYQKDPPDLAGDENFFVSPENPVGLDATLKDRSAEATERLAVFYTCLGLGFTGFYGGRPQEIRQRLLECQARIPDQLDSPDAKLCYPEAYVVDRRKLTDPPGRKLLGIAIVLIGLMVVLLVANLGLFNHASKELGKALDDINKHPARAAGEVK